MEMGGKGKGRGERLVGQTHVFELRGVRAFDVGQGYVLLDDAGFDEGVHLLVGEGVGQLGCSKGEVSVVGLYLRLRGIVRRPSAPGSGGRMVGC